MKRTMTPMDSRFLSRLAQKAAQVPETNLLASDLDLWQKRVSLHRGSAIRNPSFSSSVMTRLALCKRPRPESFRADVDQIANHLEVDADDLFALLIQVVPVESGYAMVGETVTPYRSNDD